MSYKYKESPIENWLDKCLQCYHSYYGYTDNSYICCKRADKGKDCRFYSEEEHNKRIKGRVKNR